MIEAIIFDFDGVIANSNFIKKDAYQIIFSEIKNSKEFIEKAILENSKKNRFGVIEAILTKLKEKTLINLDNLEIETKRYSQLYGEVTERETITAPEIPGSGQSLLNLSEKYPLFILTATIQESINRVVGRRNLEKYFKAIYGSTENTWNKISILGEMAKRHKFTPKKSVFVGDGEADYECAIHYQMHFIAVLNETNDFEKREGIKYKIRDLKILPEIIDTIDKEL